MNFDLLRLLAASAVVFSHCFPLAGLPAMAAPGIEDFGALGVSVFFVISGYLVTGSYQRDARGYLLKRLLRIEPGLIASLVVTVIGCSLLTLEPSYWSLPQTWLYVLRNALLYPVTYDLPGVFADNPFPHAVNGVLWTLRLEFTCYLALMLVRANRTAVAIGAGLSAAAFLAIPLFIPAWGDEAASRITFLAARNGYLFCAGSLLWLYAPKTPLWLGIAAWAAFPFAGPIVLPLAVIGVVRPGKLPADLSYGVYIYAFPLQQALAHYGMLNFASAMAATLPFAAASWFLVEKPALGLKARFGQSRAGSGSSSRPTS
ncbi:acyltransferase [Phenylobacterium sp.]|uniref:acyltransferase family protein n=1 Tax=Phenylobacterium sp. TaxID=1871053 RepID=UPI002734E5E0|nr:acyltransferase [Phenylobacterium sp.]MDP3660246.1 acyltransferase [Phenylobacterium sp.]